MFRFNIPGLCRCKRTWRAHGALHRHAPSPAIAAHSGVPINAHTATDPESMPERPGERARPMRTDAQRNRRALLDAARKIFQRDGLAAQMDDIAEQAGLGVGTLYRHFPSKDALIEVMIQERLDWLLESAQAAVRAEDPWVALSGFVWQLASFEDRGMVDILTAYHARFDASGASKAALMMDSLGAVVARAQATGQMRSDVSAQDFMVALCGIGKMIEPGSDDGEGRWRRLVSVILDGLRQSTAQPAP